MITKNITVVITAAMILSFTTASTTNVFAQGQVNQGDGMQSYIVRDQVTIPLQDLIISGGSHLHLYDTGHYHIMDGHVSVKIPCTDNGEPLLEVMGGISGDQYQMRAIELHPVTNMSMGGTCMYHSEVASEMGPEGWIYTDITLRNPSQNDITFPPNTVAIVGVNEIMMDPAVAPQTQDGVELNTGDNPQATGIEAGNSGSMNMNMGNMTGQ